MVYKSSDSIEWYNIIFNLSIYRSIFNLNSIIPNLQHENYLNTSFAFFVL